MSSTPPDGSDASAQELCGLAMAAGAGDRAALVAFIRATSPVVWRTCAVLVDPDAADDLTQDTYLRALGALARYRGEAPPIPWLLTIARRVCAEEISSRQRRRQLTERLRQRDNGGREGPFDTVALADALSRLSQPRLEALLLTAVAGMSYAEAAAACQCPIGTVRSRVNRARADLRLAMTGDEPAEHQPGDRRAG